MAGPNDDHEARLHAMRKALYQAEGEERLKLWMEYSVLQGETDDAEKHVRRLQAVPRP